MIRTRRTIVLLLLLLAAPHASPPNAGATETEQAQRTVRGSVQLQPRGPVVDADVPVRGVPSYLPTVKAGRARLADDELVLGAVIAGQPVAYPVRVLASYEIVNHRVKGRPVAPSWCPIYGTGIVFSRQLDDDERTFDFAAGLHRDNLLIADRETGSLWSQLAGAAIAGPSEGQRLTPISTTQTTWAHWRGQHPKTRVMVDEGTDGTPYYYGDYGRSTHDTSALGVGISLGGEAWFFPFVELERASAPVRMTIGSRHIVIVFEADGLTGWAEDEDGERLPSVLSYAGAWKRFFPTSRTWSAAPKTRHGL